MNAADYISEMNLQVCMFVVDETPYSIWASDLHDRNLRYVESIDPAYFDHIAELHGPLIGTDKDEYAAIAIRIAYSHALETLFALICSTIQAPDAVIGWMLRYQNKELESLVGKIHRSQQIKSVFDIGEHPSWEKFADIIFRHPPVGAGELNVKAEFSALWSRLAHDFLNESRAQEYNSMKHGMRIDAGGFTLAVGLETTPGTPAPPSAMRSLGGSKYGSSFYTVEKLQNTTNFSARKNSLNWSPESLLMRLHLISDSISNIVTFLKIFNNVNPSELQYVIPTDTTIFQRAWEIKHSISSFNMDMVIDANSITPISKEEILKAYKDPGDS